MEPPQLQVWAGCALVPPPGDLAAWISALLARYPSLGPPTRRVSFLMALGTPRPGPASEPPHVPFPQPFLLPPLATLVPPPPPPSPPPGSGLPGLPEGPEPSSGAPLPGALLPSAFLRTPNPQPPPQPLQGRGSPPGLVPAAPARPPPRPPAGCWDVCSDDSAPGTPEKLNKRLWNASCGVDLLKTRFGRMSRYCVQPICTPAAVSEAGRAGGPPVSLRDKQVPSLGAWPSQALTTLSTGFENDVFSHVLPPLPTPGWPVCTGGHPPGAGRWGQGRWCSVLSGLVSAVSSRWQAAVPLQPRRGTLPAGEAGMGQTGGAPSGGAAWAPGQKSLLRASGPGWSGGSAQPLGPGLSAKGRRRPRGRCPGSLLCAPPCLGLPLASLPGAPQCLPALLWFQGVRGRPRGAVLPCLRLQAWEPPT